MVATAEEALLDKMSLCKKMFKDQMSTWIHGLENTTYFSQETAAPTSFKSRLKTFCRCLSLNEITIHILRQNCNFCSCNL